MISHNISDTEEGDKLAFITVRNLRKVYKLGKERVYALKHIDLEIQKGEICCILGTSGSGKSTLLNMLAGLEKPTKGDIFINGVNIAKPKRVKERDLSSEFNSSPEGTSLTPAGHGKIDNSVRWVDPGKKDVLITGAYGALRIIPISAESVRIIFEKTRAADCRSCF